MKKQILILLSFLTILGISMLHSCKKDTPSNDEGHPSNDKGHITAKKTEVKTFEITGLILHQDLENKYPATFGEEPVELIKTSDSTLVFFVPDVAAGTYALKFELGTVKYKVSETQAVTPEKLISDISKKFDSQVEDLGATTTDELEELNQFKEEVLTLFNSLSDEEKRQAAAFYEANKAATQTFVSHTFGNIDGSTTMRKQSDCPKTDFKTFYGCTAGNLASAAVELKDASIDFLEMLTAAGISAALSPASFGLSAAGTILALGTAGYLLLTEVRPATLHFKHATSDFLFANWIFTKSLFEVIADKFTSGSATDLNLKPAFRSISTDDKAVVPETGFFIDAMTTLNTYWNKLTLFFGDAPAFQKTEEPATLSKENITISNISNSNVQYVGNDEKSVTFKSLSGKEEKFSFDITVEKEGFTESKTVEATIEDFKYALQIGNYNPDYSLITPQKTVQQGASISLPNYMKQMVRLTLNGEPVKVGQNGLPWTVITFGDVPTSSNAVHNADYTFTIYDATNGRNVTLHLDLTLTNEAYANLIGKPLKIWGDFYTVIFKNDGTYSYTLGETSGSGTYRWEWDIISPSYVPCGEAFITTPVIGAIYTNGAGSMTFPNYILMEEGGTFRANSMYGCPESSYYISIE